MREHTTRQGGPRLPLEPLVAAYGGNWSALARICGTTNKQLHRDRRDYGGLTVAKADRFAAAIGMHPLTIWPEEWQALLDAAAAALEAEEAARDAERKARKAAVDRRYYERHRDERLAAVKEYRTQNRRAVSLKEKLRRRANPEPHREQKRRDYLKHRDKRLASQAIRDAAKRQEAA